MKRSKEDIVKGEEDRLEFIADRDGEEAMEAFIERTYKQYRKALFNPKQHAYNREYRREFLVSCAVFREHLYNREINNE